MIKKNGLKKSVLTPEDYFIHLREAEYLGKEHLMQSRDLNLTVVRLCELHKVMFQGSHEEAGVLRNVPLIRHGAECTRPKAILSDLAILEGAASTWFQNVSRAESIAEVAEYQTALQEVQPFFYGFDLMCRVISRWQIKNLTTLDINLDDSEAYKMAVRLMVKNGDNTLLAVILKLDVDLRVELENKFYRLAHPDSPKLETKIIPEP